MAFPSGVFELVWIIMFCFGLIFGLFLIGWKKYRQKKAKPKSVLVPTDTLKTKSSLIRKSSSNSTHMNPGTIQQQSNISNNEQGTATNGTVLFEHSYLDHMGLVQPLHTVSPCLLNYFGLGPQLSVVREDSREQEQQAEMEWTDSRDQIQSSSTNNNTVVSDFNLDSNFEIISVSSSTPFVPYSNDSLATLV